MLPQKTAMAKWAITVTVLIGLGFGCKKEQDSPVPVPVPTPTPPAGFVYIKGGTFQMGATDIAGTSQEKPRHQVKLDSFFMDTTELTRGKFLEFLASSDTVYILSPFERRESYYYTGTVNTPVVGVSFRNALLYCNWRSKKEGLTPPYTFNTTDGTITYNKQANGYRLSTEAEWEYACRAGSEEDFSFGKDGALIDDYGWYAGNSSGKPQVVAGKKPNSFGLYDMHGNAAEWVWDFYDNYSDGKLENPTGPTTGTTRVYRGGSWKEAIADLRSSNRFNGGPTSRYEAVGIRLARNI